MFERLKVPVVCETLGCSIPDSNEVFHYEENRVKFSAPGITVFNEARESAVSNCGDSVSIRGYDNTAHIKEAALKCARKILSGDCHNYLCASQSLEGANTLSRIITRTQYVDFPGRYALIGME